MKTPESIIDWLIKTSDPFLRYRVEKELLGVQFAQKEEDQIYASIEESESVQTILSKMHPDGYWLQLKSNKRKYVGDGLEYVHHGSTHYCLAYLAELGITRRTRAVEKAAERYLNLQSPDGDWIRHFSCLIGYNLQTYIRLGFKNDERIKRTIQLLLYSIRYDNGYLCDHHEKRTTRNRKIKSCIRGSTKVLEAFVELGEPYWNTPECKRLKDYFLDRDGIFMRNNPSKYVNLDVPFFIFPLTYRAGLLQILCCLSKLGCGADPRLKQAWALFESKMDGEGRFPLDRTPPRCPWIVGKVGEANRWVTFYAYLALKNRE